MGLENWNHITSPLPEYASAYRHKLIPLQVLASHSKTKDGVAWDHVSVSRPDRLPTWQELTKVKNDFLGEDVEAYQVIARKVDHVNAHPFCLHLWARRDRKRVVANLHDLIDEKAWESE